LLQLPDTEWAQLYLPQAGGAYTSEIGGTTVAIVDRAVPYAMPSFLLDTPSLDGKPFYLHVVYHPDLPFVPTIRDTQTFFLAQMLQRLVYGLFLGVLLTIIALGLYIVAVLRYRGTAFFVAYLIALVINELVTTGIGNQYLWPGLGGDARLLTLLANTLAFLTFMLFVRVLLNTRNAVPRLDVLLVATFAIQIVLAIAEYAIPFGQALVAPLFAVELAGSVVIFAIAIVRRRQGSRTAAYFIAAFIPLSVGTLANILYDVLLPPGNWFLAANGVEFGTMAQCVMMSAIVLDRIYTVHRERQSARSQLTVHAQRNVELRELALTDPLTGVANRLRFYAELEAALETAHDLSETLGVLYVDLDDFKDVNDRSGHLAGDELLRTVAHRLMAVAREQDLVARLGGDEFGVLLRNLPSATMLDTVRERVVGAFAVTGTPVSVGAALYPRDGKVADAIVDAADRSMYREKQARKASRTGHASLF